MRRILFFSIFACFATNVMATPATDRFNGAWRLDLSKSDFGGDHPLPDYTISRTITLRNSGIVERDQVSHVFMVGQNIPDYLRTLEMPVDGNEHVVTGLSRLAGMPLAKMYTTARFEGDNLVISAHGDDLMGHWTTIRRLFLSANGDQLTEIIADAGGGIEFEKREVYQRESSR